MTMSAKETRVLIDKNEWVVCNDNGFVYKKRKREEKSSSCTSDILEIELKKKKRVRRRKHTLMKLKDKYEKEFIHWSNLSNSLKELEIIENQQQLHYQSQPWPDQTKLSCSLIVDDLLLQEEMRESMVRDLSEICDAAVVMCKAEEEQLKQSFFDLPVWASPRGLLASLSDQDCFSKNLESCSVLSDWNTKISNSSRFNKEEEYTR